MAQIFRIGQTATMESSGAVCTVQQFLGGGGQGEVYRADLGDKAVALKWYYPQSATPAQREALAMLIKTGAPNDKFLWPLDLASSAGVPGFGYVMPLREPWFKGLIDLMKRRIKPDPSFRALATAGFELPHNYLQLHAKGLCYRDINFGNVFFDPKTGEVRICDNDNVAVDGGPRGGVKGTYRFMAPEVVRGEAAPSIQTDLFSLAVLLFYMFVVHHPLEGKKESSIHCLDLAAMTKLYGTEPIFIFDPDNDSNRPVPGYQDNALAFWPIYPQSLRDLFTRAFTEGIRDPLNGRVREGEWRSAMVRLRDSIMYCQRCGREDFYDVDALRGSEGGPPLCWSCKKEIQLPPRIRVGRNIVMLNADTQLFPHHIDDQRMYDFSQPIAAVTQHPADPKIWGLKNLSGEKWVSTPANGTAQDVPPGRSVTLALGTRINFGRIEGEIRA